MDEEEEITLVAYWNESTTDPDITFEPCDEYKQIVLKIIVPFENSEVVSATNKLKKQTTQMQKAASKLDEASKSMSKIGNLMKRYK